jgi:hypothetical protein
LRIEWWATIFKIAKEAFCLVGAAGVESATPRL